MAKQYLVQLETHAIRRRSLPGGLGTRGRIAQRHKIKLNRTGKKKSTKWEACPFLKLDEWMGVAFIGEEGGETAA